MFQCSHVDGRMTRIAINGLGRIGRAFLKLALTQPELQVVAVNDIADADNLVYLLKFDSVYGRYSESVAAEADCAHNTLRIGVHQILLFKERDPERLPWRQLSIDIVVEATGVYASYAEARRHLQAGAGHVVLTAPTKDADTADARTVLMGVNPETLTLTKISSNGSCTTNSAASVVEVLRARIGVVKAILNTVHAYTASQSLVDGPVHGRDMRRGRAAAANIIPASTGAATAVARAIPSLHGKFDGVATRVPVLAGSLSSIVFVAARPTTVDEVNATLLEAAGTSRWSSVLAVSHEPLVSTDIVGDPHGAIVDLSLTKVVDGDLCSVYSWYDNECGFVNTLLAHVIERARTA